MSYANIFFSLGAIILAIGVAALGPAGLAGAQGAQEAMGAYLACAALCAIVGVGLLLSLRGARGGGVRTATIFLAIAWTLTPAFAATPLIFQGFSPADAYFEAVSALTTTGAWLSPSEARETSYGALWRCELQWLGGLGSLAAAAAVLTQPEILGAEVPRPPFAREGEVSSLKAMRTAARQMAPAYIILTAFCFLFLWNGGADVLSAMLLALSTLATGGFSPEPEGVHVYRSPLVELTLLVFMLIAGANFTFYWHVLTGRTSDARPDKEGFAILGAVGVGALILCVAPGSAGLENIWPNLFAASAMVSTTGYGLVGYSGPSPVLLGLALVGGAAMSTAGGLKWSRLMAMLGRVRDEVWRLNHPSGVLRGEDGLGQMSVWIFFCAYVLVLALLILWTGLFGHSFELSTVAAVAALTNTGPLLFLESATGDYADLAPPVRAALAGGMIAGRVGAIAALAMVSRHFWRS
ncbi:MAG: potassium transporter TrkG [Pseudomonadota bacterium]